MRILIIIALSLYVLMLDGQVRVLQQQLDPVAQQQLLDCLNNRLYLYTETKTHRTYTVCDTHEITVKLDSPKSSK